MKILLTISCFLLAINIYSQDKLNSTLQDFRRDSLGCLGLRTKHIVGTNDSNDQMKLDQQSLIGKTKTELIKLIGPANYSQKSTSKSKKNIADEQLYYYIKTCGGKKPGVDIVILLKKEIVISTGMVPSSG